jgi:hypothetical protein
MSEDLKKGLLHPREHGLLQPVKVQTSKLWCNGCRYDLVLCMDRGIRDTILDQVQPEHRAYYEEKVGVYHRDTDPCLHSGGGCNSAMCHVPCQGLVLLARVVRRKCVRMYTCRSYSLRSLDCTRQRKHRIVATCGILL